MRQAFVIAACCNLLGAVSMGGTVTQTIRKGIINLKEFENDDDPEGLMLLMLTAMLGSISYVASATKLGMPVSTTQSILGGLVGSMIVRDKGKLTGVKWMESGTVCRYSMGRVSCGGVLGIVLQWVFAPIMALVLASVLFTFTRFVLLTAPAQDAERRAAPLMSVFFGGVSFALAWFIIIQENHHPHSRGWAPRNASDNINSATALEYAVVVLVGVGSAYLALAVFSLRPDLLHYVPYSLAHQDRASVELVEENGQFHHEGDDDSAPSNDTKPSREAQTLNPIAIVTDLSRGGDSLGESSAQLGAAEDYGERMESLFGTAQICTAALAAFAAGANDVANEVAPLAAILQTYRNAEVRKDVRTPRWLFAYAGCGIGLGLALFGKRVMKTVGKDTTQLTPSRGFHVELGYSLASLIASAEGWPVSTTQLAIGALVGVGLLSGADISTAVNFKLLGRIFCAWVLTPVCTAVFAMLYFALLRPAI